MSPTSAPALRLEEGALLTTGEVARLLAVKPQTIRAWRLKGQGPAFIKQGNCVRYHRDQVQAWFAKCTQIASNS